MLKEYLGDKISLELSWGKKTELDVETVKLDDDGNICKYLCRISKATELFNDEDILVAGAIESWLNFAAGPLANPKDQAELNAALKVLEKQLVKGGKKFLIGDHYTIADFVVFGGLVGRFDL